MTSIAPNPSRRQPLVVLGIALSLSVLVVAVWFARNESGNRINRAVLVSLHTGLEPGQTPEVVRNVMLAIGNTALHLHENSASDWFVRMPMEWGGSDWLLRIEFTGGKVSAIRVRNADGAHPDGAPRDKAALPPSPTKRQEPEPSAIRISSLSSPC